MKFIFLIFVAVFLTTCSKAPGKPGETPLARVFESYLYPSDLKGVVPEGISGQDSISFVNDFVEKWIRNQLLLNIAESNLSEQEKDVARQIENYRSSLLIYAYQQSYLHNKLDTVVNETEIESYYTDNPANFVLNEPMMKGLYIKLRVNAPELYKLRQWYRSDNPKDLNNLEGYCFSHAIVYDHFNESWVNVNEVVRMIPADDQILLNTLKNRKYIEIRDQNYYYFVNARELAGEGTTAPYELVRNDIHSIILNKRKVQVISELESSLYSDAQNREHFTIYK
jgi:hypothetical protein